MRLRELVVALCFLAVFIDTLVKLEADYTTLETLQKLGFLRMIALKTLQKLGLLRMIALKTLQKLGNLRMVALKTLQKLGFLRMIALKTLQKLGFLMIMHSRQCKLFAVGLEHKFTGWKCCKS